ncbi:signal recognition particle-docking protein FtsY [Corynebacterium breve]|uniref:Signal recognition particle receptor FtsY n=1 Tax=Corynebacterium breve TaxID=3049799 RepID=A0ABY8VE51_9CORY|nr:signal recognition particle-docking protein FtsY [Corynebacterium breve]WIM66908.1 signal recognition particle-docking protein FtsY [Corynebacterium breve]
MNSTLLWILIAVVVLLLIIVGIVVIGNNRKKSKTISFEKQDDQPKELTQQEKSGNYQAQGGFNFAPANAPEKEPVRVDKPLDKPTAKPAEMPVAKPVEEPVEKQIAPEQPQTRIIEETVPEPVATTEPVEGAEPIQQELVDSELNEPELRAETSEESQRLTGASEAVAAGAGTAAVVGAAAAAHAEDGEEDGEKDVVRQEEQEEPAEEIEVSEEAVEAAEHVSSSDTVQGEADEDVDLSPLFDDLAEETVNDPETTVDVAKQLDEAESHADAEDTRTVEEEAQEAADIAQVTAEVAEAAREQTPVPEGEPAPAPAPIDDIDPAAGRIGRLRGRLSRSQNAIGQGLLGILTAGDLDEDAWEDIEDTLIMADLGAELTMKVTDSLREKIAERGVSSEEEARAMLRETLIEAGRPDMDRSIKAMPVDGKPAVILVVGVNGTGKTTTTGKLARVLVSMGHKVVLGAADTFRAAAADQLETWGRRVGAETVRGPEGADPASVAFDAVARGVEQQADVVMIDTAGRLHTATGLMDQLGKVKRVVEKKSQVDEVLLVLDATVGQNGLTQARVFRDVVDITGVVLTKLDGTAKGGIVFQVQEELGVPVKLVGLGEGADDLAPFEVEGFVDALLG